MFVPPFCPYKACPNHVVVPDSPWYRPVGYHHTKAFGAVRRFRCLTCNRTFSVQTFSVHYYAKKVLSLRRLEHAAAESGSIRALSRLFNCSCGTIVNRIDRIARQAISLHATLRPRIAEGEPVSFDGLVSFDESQYFPNDIGISITAESRFVLGLSHATTRRSGTMTESQKRSAERRYEHCTFELKAIERSFTEHLDLLERERARTKKTPLILITDQKLEYQRALRRHRLYRTQDEEHRVAQVLIPSTLPRDYWNPLFASNYMDRQVRKDQAHHRRETTCFCRNGANGMSRLMSYIVRHNYEKKYLIKWPVDRTETHAEMAGLDRKEIRRMRREMFTKRAFLSFLDLLPIDLKIWRKEVWRPQQGALVRGSLPAFAFM